MVFDIGVIVGFVIGLLVIPTMMYALYQDNKNNRNNNV